MYTNDYRQKLQGHGNNKGTRGAARWQALMGAIMVGSASMVQAAAITWDDGTSLWEIGVNWSSDLVPVAGDDVTLSIAGSTVFYTVGTPGTLNSLTISAAASATTLLQAGGTLSSKFETVGGSGFGTYTQTAGINSIEYSGVGTGQLALGNSPGGVGTYNLVAGNLTADSIRVGSGFATGNFVQSGGSVVLTRDPQSALAVGNGADSTATYQMSGGTLDASRVLVAVVGDSAGERKFVQTGGTSTTGSLEIGGFTGGSTVTEGSYALSGAGAVLNSSIAYVGVSGIGTFTQEGGTFDTEYLLVGATEAQVGSEGTYLLKSGSLSVEGLFVGNPGRGTFIQTGGTNTVTGQLAVDSNDTAASSGTYTISGGTLTTVGSGGFGSLVVDVGATFNLNGGTVFANGPTLQDGLGNFGDFNLNGGTLAGTSGKINDGNFSGHGLITGSGTFVNNSEVAFSGGTTTIESDVLNNSGGTIQVGEEVTVFEGTVTNFGKIGFSGRNAIFNGDLINAGEVGGDPTFNGLFSVISPGFIVANAGDPYVLGGNVDVTTTNRTQWSTLPGIMEIYSGPSGTTLLHNFVYSGLDLGPTALGYTNNMAWGRVIVNPGNSLVNTNDGALYAKALILGGGVLANAISQISTFTGNMTIYYDPADSNNTYLAGGTYPFLTGSGDGKVAPIPEPTSLALLALGLTPLGFRRRRTN